MNLARELYKSTRSRHGNYQFWQTCLKKEIANISDKPALPGVTLPHAVVEKAEEFDVADEAPGG